MTGNCECEGDGDACICDDLDRVLSEAPDPSKDVQTWLQRAVRESNDDHFRSGD